MQNSKLSIFLILYDYSQFTAKEHKPGDDQSRNPIFNKSKIQYIEHCFKLRYYLFIHEIDKLSKIYI